MRAPRRAGVALVDALVGHPTLAKLNLKMNCFPPHYDPDEEVEEEFEEEEEEEEEGYYRRVRSAPSWAGDELAVGDSLGRLVAADAPALVLLDVSFCFVYGAPTAACLGPLFDELATNTHLRWLDVSWNGLSGAGAGRLLRGVVSNRGLTFLSARGRSDPHCDVARAEALVAARRG